MNLSSASIPRGHQPFARRQHPRSTSSRATPCVSGQCPQPLRLGDSLVIDPPLIAAPMAGISNAAYREICRESGAGMCVSEMLVSSLLLQRSRETQRIARPYAGELPRSYQIYGVDPAVVAAAARVLVSDFGAQHIDLNYGCPVRSVVCDVPRAHPVSCPPPTEATDESHL